MIKISSIADLGHCLSVLLLQRKETNPYDKILIAEAVGTYKGLLDTNRGSWDDLKKLADAIEDVGAPTSQNRHLIYSKCLRECRPLIQHVDDLKVLKGIAEKDPKNAASILGSALTATLHILQWPNMTLEDFGTIVADAAKKTAHIDLLFASLYAGLKYKPSNKIEFKKFIDILLRILHHLEQDLKTHIEIAAHEICTLDFPSSTLDEVGTTADIITSFAPKQVIWYLNNACPHLRAAFKELGAKDVSEEVARCIQSLPAKVQFAALTYWLPNCSICIKQINDIKTIMQQFSKVSRHYEDQLTDILGMVFYKEFFSRFGMEVFDKLLIPIAKSQQQHSSKCSKKLRDIQRKWQGSGFDLSIPDLEFLAKVITMSNKTAAYTLEHLIEAGIDAKIFPGPLHAEREIIMQFLRETPVVDIELYVRFREIFNAQGGRNQEQITKLFAKVHEWRKELRSGTYNPREQETLMLKLLFNMFKPGMTKTLADYKTTIESREDRQADIPSSLHRVLSMNVKLSKGGYVVHHNENIDFTPWQELATLVEESGLRKRERKEIGLSLLAAVAVNIDENGRKSLLHEVYACYSEEHGRLEVTMNSYEELSRTAEFIGDKLNDTLNNILSDAATDERYAKAMAAIQRPPDFSRLGRTLTGLWQSGVADKEKRVRHILQLNDIPLEETIPWQPEWGKDEITAWLSAQQETVLEKGTIAKIKNRLFGDLYERMQRELKKYSFVDEGRSFFESGETYTFVLSKRKAHSVAMYSMGVCVAVDDKLWNDPAMWQLVIFDDDDYAMGGAIYRILEEDGKQYLAVSLNPSTELLNNVSTLQLYNKMIQYSKIMVRKLGFTALLIPKNSVIHSNRPAIQTEISKRNYPTKILRRHHKFSFKPPYQYIEFYIVP